MSGRRVLQIEFEGEEDTPVEIPEVRYAKTGDHVYVAYQVMGSGPADLVHIPGFVSHLEYQAEWPLIARFNRRLAAFSRLILFDKRGTGMSDRDVAIPTLETRMDDVRAVMDAAGSERAALFGISEGVPMSLLFAATYPERATALITYGAGPRHRIAPDYPWGEDPKEWEEFLVWMEDSWGTEDFARAFAVDVAPSLAKDEDFIRSFSAFLRRGASPGAAVSLLRVYDELDLRDVLPSIRVPTMVLSRGHSGEAEWMAGQVPGAKYIPLPGEDYMPWSGNQDDILDEVEAFVTGARPEPDLERVLATVLFTDIVGSTERAAALGDRRWKSLLEDHDAAVRTQVTRYRGREVDTAGDGFFITFDGPARGVHCARAITQAVQPLGLAVRAGLHTGECEVMGQKVGGIAVHIGARVASLAGPGEVFVSSTVKDLVAGSGLVFEDAGKHELKGVPGKWHLYAVAGG